uniref:Potassium channel domain-containing protein n=1 Tax=Globisporangium ultimum (strain ATCC 200006 / CBS 805.95 / DAOM BR144) TaxID=431595 RepID=K3WDZ1_GLOUD
MAQRRKEIRAQRIARLKSALQTLLTIAALLDAVYVLVSVPLRIGFLFDPSSRLLERGKWTNEFTLFSILDITGEIVRLAYLYTERKMIMARFVKSYSSQLLTRSLRSMKSVGRPRLRAVMPQLSGLHVAKRRSLSSISLFSTRDDDATGPAVSTAETASVIQNTVERKTLPLVMLFFLLLPLDIIAAATFNYNWIHVARAGKLFVRILSFSTLSLPFYLFWLGLYLCHVSACGYMLIAHIECGLTFSKCSMTPEPGCWVLKDRLDQGSLWRQYIRTMYWASKTITTLGQGDMVPVTQFETNYCVIVQYISGLWATSFLSACSFYFSRRGAGMDESASTRLEQALMFFHSSGTLEP